MARLEGAYEQVSQRLMNIELRLDGLDRKIDLVADALGKKIDALDLKIDQRFMWTIGVVITTWLTTMATTIATAYLHH